VIINERPFLPEGFLFFGAECNRFHAKSVYIGESFKEEVSVTP